MIGFLRPELWLLALPALWLWWRLRGAERGTQAIRLCITLLLVAALAAPVLRTRADGRDLIVVMDRSRSMPPGAGDTALELIALAEDERQKGDRLGVVSFGSHAAIETLPNESGRFPGFAAQLDPEGSGLADALEAALLMVPDGRQGSLLVLSDGEYQGRDPLELARRAFARGIRLDVRPLRRARATDLSVERLGLPEAVGSGEPFQFSAWVHTDDRVEATYVLKRDGEPISRGKRFFEPGANRLLFRDVLRTPGIATYALEVDLPGDRLPENNRGLAALEVRGARALLVVNHDGTEDTLVRALRRAELEVDVVAPENVRIDPIFLAAYRGVVLENVAARRLGTPAIDALRNFVLERGGGLCLTGGQASFGVGGYHLTAIDELLPVSMELREEHRKQGVALAIVMDRSGSMSAPVGSGIAGGSAATTKMDLANQGAAAAIQLLSSLDSVAVIAVDSSAHLIAPMTPVEDPAALLSRVRSIESMGGGIYVHTGMKAAVEQLDFAPQLNRHVVLFADAADAEEQGGVLSLVERQVELGTTVSVIALGTEADSDAGFLKQVAARGQGDVYFTIDPVELPKLFAQDTMTIARSSFLEEETQVAVLADVFGLGQLELAGFPALEGYNLNYLREGATAGVATLDEYRAPILAFWHQGIGRTAAYCGQIGGSFGRRITSWAGFSELFVTLARWLAGAEEPTEIFASVRREGSDAVFRVEVDPGAPVPPDTANLKLRLGTPAGEYEEHLFERVGEHRHESRVRLGGSGVSLGTLRLADGRFVNLPPVALPYSPEFERATDPEAGERFLRRLADETLGAVDPPAHELFRGERAARSFRLVAREFALLALVLTLLEIAARRLGLWSLARRATDAREPARPAKRRPKRAPSPGPSMTPTSPSDAPVASAPPGQDAMGKALERARESATRKLDR